jgi:nucleotide-binding universal stress UspA family protein
MTKPSWTKILATTDFSSHSNSAVDLAHGLAEMVGAELHVLHVVDDATDAAANYGATGVFDPKTMSSSGNPWLRGLLGDQGKVRRIEAVRIGKDVPEKIVEYAASNGIDLVVMASHGRTGLAHLWLGSNAEKVVRSSPCPVLVLRPRPESMPAPTAADAGGAK